MEKTEEQGRKYEEMPNTEENFEAQKKELLEIISAFWRTEYDGNDA